MWNHSIEEHSDTYVLGAGRARGAKQRREVREEGEKQEVTISSQGKFRSSVGPARQDLVRRWVVTSEGSSSQEMDTKASSYQVGDEDRGCQPTALPSPHPSICLTYSYH